MSGSARSPKFCLYQELQTHGLTIDIALCCCEWHCQPILDAYDKAQEEEE